MQFGTPIPQVIIDAPDLQPGLELYFEAFWALSSCRQIGMSAGPIGWVDCNTYATVLHLDEEQADDLWFFISAMDAVFLKHLADKRAPAKP